MVRITLEAGDDHVQALAHEKDPFRAILELIWNSLDADADHVAVTLQRNTWEGIDGVVVTDDGVGIPPESVERAFRWIGNSWKRNTRRTPGRNRPIHGRYGQGRLRAWALGSSIEWETVAVSTDTKKYRTRVRGEATDRNHLTPSDPEETIDSPGTTFRASGRDGLNRLATKQAADYLAIALAPHLMANDTIVVTYNGDPLDATRNLVNDTGYHDLTWTYGDQEHRAHVRLIEWTDAERNSLHLCDADGVPIEDTDAPHVTNFRYSAYVLWQEMPKHHSEWLLARLDADSVVVGLAAAVEDFIDAHFEARRAEMRREVVRTWVENRTYPYDGDPASAEEVVERAAFDVVATSIQRHIPRLQKQQRLSLGLLRQSLQQTPSDVGELLDQFLGLPPDERAELDRLLKRTSLSRLITATTNVTNPGLSRWGLVSGV